MGAETVKDRLLKLLKAKNISQAEFCRRMGVSNTFVGAMRKGMKQDKLKKTCELFPDLNRDWLAYGEGEMLIVPETRKEGIIRADHETILLPIEAFAGNLNLWSSGARKNECRPFISPLSGVDFAITIKGDSMEPKFHEGTILLIKKLDDMTFIPWGHTLVVDTEKGVFVKNILPEVREDGSENPDWVVAKSLNSNYPPFRIPRASILGIYRVLGTIDIYPVI